MCLAIPGKVVDTYDQRGLLMAKVQFGGIVREGCLEVRDHGPGIAAEDLARVFDRFYRAPAARWLPGSGLGLAIVRQVAETHGGTVHAANDPAGGARLSADQAQDELVVAGKQAR